MKKFFALSFCLLLALVIAGCCSSCPVKKGCNRDSRCALSENCSSMKCSKTQCPVAKCAAAGCEKCCGSKQCADCCDKGKCSKPRCSKTQCPVAKCAAAGCEKCCGSEQCAKCCDKGKCSKPQCSGTQCPVAKCAAAGCEKCCGSEQCAKCCDKGKCSKGKCNMKPQVCPVKQKAGMSLNWKLDLSSLQGVKANAVKPEQDIVLGFDFAKRRCYGVSGVNRYFGPITVNPKEGKMSFGQLGSTMMMGPGLDYEQAYLKMLSTVDGCNLDNGQLILTSKGKVVARYVPIDKIK